MLFRSGEGGIILDYTFFFSEMGKHVRIKAFKKINRKFSASAGGGMKECIYAGWYGI